MHARQELENAKQAIKDGNIDALKKALDATYTIQETYTYWAPPEGNWTYELGIPDDIEHTGVRDVTNNYIDIALHGGELLLAAAETNQLEALNYLVSERKIHVTPAVMKKYLDLYKTQLLPNLKNAELAGHVVRELNERLFQSTYDVALEMFKHFLLYQLFNGTDKSIQNIIEKVGDYLPKHTAQYAKFMQFSKDHIFAYGQGSLVKSLDPVFKFSEDMKFLQEMNDWFKGDRLSYLDESKNAFIYEHLSTQETVDKINQKYDALIQATLNSVQQLNISTQGRKTEFFFSKSRATTTQGLFQAITDCQQENISSVNKILKIATLLVQAYNNICDKVKNSYTQNTSTTANEILAILKTLCDQAQITLQHKNLPKYSIQPVKIIPSERIQAEARILAAERFTHGLKKT